MKKTICIAGKNEIAVNGLAYVLAHYPDHQIVCLPNATDAGSDTWQPSLRRFCRQNDIREVRLCDLYDVEDLVFVSLEYAEIIDPARFSSNALFNIHFSLLPKYKGMYTSALPLLNGEIESGVTLHRIERGIDTGDIIAQLSFELGLNDTARDLYFKYMDGAFQLFSSAIQSLISGAFTAAPQSAIGASYFSKAAIDYSRLAISFRKTAFEVHNQFRAYTFREYQMPEYAGWQIARTEITGVKSRMSPGVIVRESAVLFQVSTIDYDILLFKDYYPQFWSAAASGNLDQLNASIENIDDVNLRNGNGWAALAIAAYHGHEDVIARLLAVGANVQVTNYKGTTVLMYAFSHYESSGRMQPFMMLLAHGCDPQVRDKAGKSVGDYMRERACHDLLHLIDAT